MGVNGSDDRVICPPVLDHPDGVVEGEGLSVVGVGIPASFEAEVVSSSAALKGCLELGPLPLGWEYPVPEGIPHETPPCCHSHHYDSTKMKPASHNHFKETIFLDAAPIPRASPPRLRLCGFATGSGTDLPDATRCSFLSSQMGFA
jgi:hypothetical protein